MSGDDGQCLTGRGEGGEKTMGDPEIEPYNELRFTSPHDSDKSSSNPNWCKSSVKVDRLCDSDFPDERENIDVKLETDRLPRLETLAVLSLVGGIGSISNFGSFSFGEESPCLGKMCMPGGGTSPRVRSSLLLLFSRRAVGVGGRNRSASESSSNSVLSKVVFDVDAVFSNVDNETEVESGETEVPSSFVESADDDP